MGLWDRLHKDDQGAGPSIAEAVATARSSSKSSQAEHHDIWGRPGRCPECGGVGYLDRIDVIDRIMFEHCPDCFHKWTVAEQETVRAG